jgi:hypothetical protein
LLTAVLLASSLIQKHLQTSAADNTVANGFAIFNLSFADKNRELAHKEVMFSY